MNPTAARPLIFVASFDFMTWRSWKTQESVWRHRDFLSLSLQWVDYVGFSNQIVMDHLKMDGISHILTPLHINWCWPLNKISTNIKWWSTRVNLQDPRISLFSSWCHSTVSLKSIHISEKKHDVCFPMRFLKSAQTSMTPSGKLT